MDYKKSKTDRTLASLLVNIVRNLDFIIPNIFIICLILEHINVVSELLVPCETKFNKENANICVFFCSLIYVINYYFSELLSLVFFFTNLFSVVILFTSNTIRLTLFEFHFGSPMPWLIFSVYLFLALWNVAMVLKIRNTQIVIFSPVFLPHSHPATVAAYSP